MIIDHLHYIHLLTQHQGPTVLCNTCPVMKQCSTLLTLTNKQRHLYSSRKFVAFEVAREDEFSPLKNAAGAPLDTPSSARQSLLALHLRWVLAAGARFLEAPGGATRPR